MAERERESSQGGERLEARERELRRSESTQLKRFTRIIRFADFMAILMVAATAFTAFATWRTAEVTSLVFAVSDRPFIGVEKVEFERADSGHPQIVVDFRNFGHIPAADALVSVHVLLDGKEVKPEEGEMDTVDHGVVSPGVPHFFYAFLDSDNYKSVVAGSSHLMVRVNIEYKGPELARRYCYAEKVVFDHRVASFRHVGGTDKCANTDIY